MVNTANDVEAMYRRVDSEDWDGDAPSDLDDPSIYGKAGEIYRVRLLIGKAYDVESSRPFDVVARSDERIEVTEIGAGRCEIVWPVTFTVAEGRAPGCRPRLGATWNDGGKSFYVMPTTQRFSLTSLGTFTIKKIWIRSFSQSFRLDMGRWCAFIWRERTMRVKTIWVILTLAVLTAGIMLSLQKFRQTEGRKRAFSVYTYEAGCAQTNRIIKTAARSSPRMGNYQDPSVILRDDVEEFLSRMPKTLLANEFAKCTLSDCCEEKDAAVFESLTFETTPDDPTAKVSVSAKSEEYALAALKFTMRHFDEFVEMKRRMRNEKAIAHLRYKMKQMERKGEDILSISNLINETWAVVDACGNRVRLIVPPTCAK